MYNINQICCFQSPAVTGNAYASTLGLETNLAVQRRAVTRNADIL